MKTTKFLFKLPKILPARNKHRMWGVNSTQFVYRRKDNLLEV